MERKLQILVFMAICVFLQLPARAAVNKEDAARHYRLGNIYYENGLYQEAQDEFRKALSYGEESNIPKVSSDSKGLNTSQAPGGQMPFSREETGEYIINAGDTLSVSVWENDDLNKDVIVRPDGKISFPLINELQAQGLTIPQLDKEITKKLAQFIRRPDVNVALKAMGGNRVLILGEVTRPGVYALENRKTVLEAVALAGGFTKDAVLNSVVVIKGGIGSPEACRVNLSEVLKKGILRDDIALVSQDIVFVPRKFISNLNYFLSQILDPISKGSYIYRESQSW